jgi:putative transposase
VHVPQPTPRTERHCPWLPLPHRLGRRGNGRQFILATDSERTVCLDLLGQAVKLHGVAVVCYCPMSNHVHVVLIPHQAEALTESFRQVHGRYASYWNVGHAGSDHVWQGALLFAPRGRGPPRDSSIGYNGPG